MGDIIQIKNLRKVYRIGNEKVIALNRINLSVKKGEICCIFGTSGSGKSTLLNIVAGLEKPTKGDVYIGKTNVTKLNEKRLAIFRQKYIGFVFQSYNLMPALTALENVSMPLMFRGVPSKKREKSASAILKAVGLENRIKHKPSQMSGGQQQRVGIARAFVSKPAIIFADEPTGNLDSKTTEDVMNLIVGMSRKYNLTVILVTHDPEIAKYSDRIVHIIDGDIVEDKPNESIYQPLEKADKEKQEDINTGTKQSTESASPKENSPQPAITAAEAENRQAAH